MKQASVQSEAVSLFEKEVRTRRREESQPDWATRVSGQGEKSCQGERQRTFC